MKRLGIFGDYHEVQKEKEILSNFDRVTISGFYFNENIFDIFNLKRFENFNELIENSDIVEFLTPSKDIYKYISKTIKNSKNLILNPDILKAKDFKKLVTLAEEAEIKFYLRKNENLINKFKNNIKNPENINCLNIKYFNNNIYYQNQLFLMVYDLMTMITSLDNFKINKINSYKFSTQKTNDSAFINLLTSKSNIINLTIISQFYKNMLTFEVYSQDIIYEINLIENDYTDNNEKDINMKFALEKFENHYEIFDPEKEIYPIILTYQIIEN